MLSVSSTLNTSGNTQVIHSSHKEENIDYVKGHLSCSNLKVKPLLSTYGDSDVMDNNEVSVTSQAERTVSTKTYVMFPFLF